MKINLSKEIDLVIQPAQIQTINEIEIMSMMDNPNDKIVQVLIRHIGWIDLFVGDQYDLIGQWTDQDIINELKNRFDPAESTKKSKKK